MPGTDTTEELIEILDGIEGRRYAVVDAAHFDNLQDLLTDAGLPFHPLYLDEKDPSPDTEIAGPHLVELPSRSSARKLIALADNKPAIVWWVWPEHGEATTDEIYRHLRRLNVAEIPGKPKDPDTTGDDDETKSTEGAASAEAAIHAGDHENHSNHTHDDNEPVAPPDSYNIVIFRHSDPRVMAMLLPLLDAAQVSRLFGDAEAIVIDQDKVASFPRPRQLPLKPRGLLRILPEQYGTLDKRNQSRNDDFIAKYLQRVLPEATHELSRDQLYEMVRQAEANRRSLGIRSQKSAAKWAYLEMFTGGRILQQDGVRRYMTNGEHTPDRKVDLMMRSLSAAYRQIGKTGP
ncbi:DUF4123 domain-containing protein [Hoeflea ulvae]|uniref:DUF4123 domain-containing protein n=1 Tax=Hoeflea ulvae TaxID=2983764 RepID=A0ABT3YH17_9HYPH|nr:DUF4123 domain-containing protein [Hoeflea ulvae]MCY0095197.1 DUF4123 domain-containing protein [Hoeflea ulvae]